MTALRSAELTDALRGALDRGDTRTLFERLLRASGLPGPRPNMELARVMGGAIAGEGRRADALVSALVASDEPYLVVVGLMAHAARYLAGVDAAHAMRVLHDHAEDARRLVREGVVHALRAMLVARGAMVVRELATWTDGYLHAHVALEALSDRTLLAQLQDAEGEVLARLDEAFELGDASPRSHERTQGLRALRRGLPEQIARIAARYPSALDWLEERSQKKRPETREVIAETIDAVRKSLSGAEADRLARSLAASAPAPRDPTRIVHGTRRRGRK